MAGFTDFTVDYGSMGRYLRTSSELRTAVLRHAESGVVFAKSIAPVGPASDPHRGQFRDSIHAEPSTTTGGYIAARIVADEIWAEFGRRRTHPYAGAYALRRTAHYLNTAKR